MKSEFKSDSNSNPNTFHFLFHDLLINEKNVNYFFFHKLKKIIKKNVNVQVKFIPNHL